MAAAVLTDSGLLASLDDRLAARLFIRLYRNDRVPLVGDTLDLFTTAVFPSYADQELTGLWPAAALDGAGRAYSTLTLTWTRGAGGVPETEYGWVLYERPAPDSFLVAAKRLTIPIATVLPGDTAIVQITLFALRG